MSSLCLGWVCKNRTCRHCQRALLNDFSIFTLAAISVRVFSSCCLLDKAWYCWTSMFSVCRCEMASLLYVFNRQLSFHGKHLFIDNQLSLVTCFVFRILFHLLMCMCAHVQKWEDLLKSSQCIQSSVSSMKFSLPALSCLHLALPSVDFSWQIVLICCILAFCPS